MTDTTDVAPPRHRPAPPARGPADVPEDVAGRLERVEAKLDQLLEAQDATALIVATASGHLSRLAQLLQDVDRLGPVGYVLQARKARRHARRPQGR